MREIRVARPVTPGLVLSLEQELVEAETEIARHHRDFQAIRDILDRTKIGHPGQSSTTFWDMLAALKAIRNIVG